MNAIAVDDVPKVDTFGGLRRETETPEQALRRLERKNNFTKVIGTDEGQRLLAAATAQVKAQPNGGLDLTERKARGAKVGAAVAYGATMSEAVAIADGVACEGSNHVPGCEHFPAPAATPTGPSAEAVLADVALDLVDIGANVRADPGELQGLADSIVELGLQQPVTVTLTKAGRYTLLLGQRRVLASRLANLPTIRAIVVADPADVLAKPGARRSSEQLAENRVRLAMNPVDEAITLRAILDGEKKLTQVALARRLGMSEPWIASTLALLKAPAKVQELVRSDQLSIAHAKAIAGLPADDQVRLAKSAADNGVSAHSLEESAKWERQRVRDREAGKERTAGAAKRGLAALETAGTPKDARLFVNTDHWQIQDADVRKVIREAGYKVDDGWARSGERWSKCDCTALHLRIRDGEGSTISTVCVSDAHERAWQKERNAKATERQAAEEADRKRLASFIRAAMPPELNPTLGRLILKALDGYYGKTWTEYAKLTDEAVLKAIAAKLTSEEVLRGVSYNGDAKRIPLKTLIKELGGVEENSPTLAAKHPRRRPPEAIAAEAVADA